MNRSTLKKTVRLVSGFVASPTLGEVWMAAGPHGLVALDFPSRQEKFFGYLQKLGFNLPVVDPKAIEPYTRQIEEYLHGARREFTFAIDWSFMPDFQRQVLQATYAIPFGKTKTYLEIAHIVGKPGAPIAVGQAEARNPMPLVVPCHRVVGSDGSLHGYGAGEGVKTKAWLLELERRV